MLLNNIFRYAKITNGENYMVKLVIDMMGGDNGTKATIEGVKIFLNEIKDCEVVAVGNLDALSELTNLENVTIVESKDIVPMECSVMQAMRMKDSSIYKAVNAVIKTNADGIISAGSTGAFLSLTSLIIKKIDGVSRPALITPFPTKIANKYVVLLDVGASSENNANELYQFAKMGEAYYKVVYAKNDPNVYLISNGSEEGKGTPLYKEAYAMLKSDTHFKGYIEGRYVFNGDADVVVMDGFTGNVFLKTSEGMAKMMSGLMKEAFLYSSMTKLGYLFARKGFDKLKETMDYKKVGGALLLGVNTVAVKAHGNSTPDSFYHSMMIAYKLAKNKVVEQIKGSLKANEANQ